MSETKKPNAMIEIHPGSPEWQAWLKHHRGTKSETRMLLCLGGKTKTGEIIPPRPWLARSKFPPDAPKPENAPRSLAQVAPSWALPMVHASVPEGRFDEVVNRMTAVEERRAKENEIKHRRRKDAKRSENILEAALEAAAVNHEPYINGAEYLGTLEVPDPLEEQEIIRAGRGHFVRTKKDAPLRTRVISLRNDPIGQMAKRGQLGCGAERDVRLRAARHWQRLYEIAEIGGARGIDPTKDSVDGGRFEMPDTDARLRALAELNRLCRSLKLEEERLLTWVLEVKRTLKQFAGLFAKATERDVSRLGERLAGALDKVAELVGFKIQAKRSLQHRDMHATLAAAAENLEFHRAIQRAKRGT